MVGLILIGLARCIAMVIFGRPWLEARRPGGPGAVRRSGGATPAEEKARAVLREVAGEQLRKLLARLPPGRAVSEAAAERLGEEAARAARKGV